MKIVWLLICIVFAGCGPKSNEDIAKDLITEKLKTSLPDFENYESVNFGMMGTAFQPYEETDQYIASSTAIKACKDSVILLEKLISENKSTSTETETYRNSLKKLQDSISVKNKRNSAAKQGYTPKEIFKISHTYIIKDKSGQEKKTEDEFYIDKELKKVLKVHKVY